MIKKIRFIFFCVAALVLFSCIFISCENQWMQDLIKELKEKKERGDLLKKGNEDNNGGGGGVEQLITMVYIPAGSFLMGSSDLLDYDADPPHSVTLIRGFYMGKYEVTQEQYQKVMGTNPSIFGPSNNLPVEMVSWYDAIEFCNKLSIMENLTPFYSIDKINQDPNNLDTGDPYKWTIVQVSGANGYRLPTEAEWEYACRAGKEPYEPYNPLWDGTTAATAPGWYNNNSDNKTHEVGKKSANAFGLYDMHGNVWEWCWDWYGAYSSGAEPDPTGAFSGFNRVLRGGSWYY